MTLIFNVPEDRIGGMTGGSPVEYMLNTFLSSGIHFSRGIRGYYFIIPLILWMFHPLLMLSSFSGIIYFPVKRDLGMVPC